MQNNDESQNHDDEWKKPGMKGYLLYNFLYMKVYIKQI